MSMTTAQVDLDLPGLGTGRVEQLKAAGFVDRDHVNDVLTTWPEGGQKLARFLGTTPDVLLQCLGWQDFPQRQVSVATPYPIGGAVAPARHTVPSDPAPATKLPTMVSWLSRFGPARSQGTVGSCTGFAAVAALEARAQDPMLDLSEAFVYALTKAIDGIQAEGSTLDFATRVALEHGAPPENDWPYVSDFEHLTRTPSQQCFDCAKLHRTPWRAQLRPTDVRAVQAHVARGSAVAISVPIHESTFWSRRFRWEGRLLDRLGVDDAIIGGHALTVVGYAENTWLRDHGLPEGPGGGIFVARNSWGSDWATRNPLVIRLRQGRDTGGYALIPFAFLANQGWEAIALARPAPTGG